MTIGILAAVLGLLIAAAAISIPRIVGRGNKPEDHSDSLAYLKQTGAGQRRTLRTATSAMRSSRRTMPDHNRWVAKTVALVTGQLRRLPVAGS
jgi:hypothetical protein